VSWQATLLLGLGAAAAAQATPGWPQWGGPDRTFAVPAAPLAESWPGDAPPVRWRRPLGDGFSGIVTDGETLYTTYRSGTDDVAVALSAGDGRTLWQTPYPAPFVETCSERLGAAPRAAPLIDADRLVTTTAGGAMLAFDRRNGKLLWRVELVAEDSEAAKPCGYASSPVAFDGALITMAGGKGRGVVAIDGATGRLRWASQDFLNGYSSPLIVDVVGRPQLIAFTAGEISGLDPRTGALDWSLPHPADFGVNVAMPTWGADGLLFVSSAYNGGSRVLRLVRKGDRIVPEELWANKRVRIHFGNAARIGDVIYASNGDLGTAPLAAVDVRTGEIVWRDRAAARASLIASGDRLLILDENGMLVLARPGPGGLGVLAKAQVLNNRSWTAPTLSGTTLYVRDQKEIVALELGHR
jgi:outer membrane protein assembly factor BamB